MFSQLMEWLFQSSERRRAERYDRTETIAFFWDGSVPVPHEIADISMTGAYLHTMERWYPGTIVNLTLKTNRPETDTQCESIEARCRVVRHGPDGVGLQFVSFNANGRKAQHGFLVGLLSSLRKNKAAHRNTNDKGQALTEFALLLPFLLLLIANVVNMGMFLYAYITVSDSARTGAQYAVLSGASVNSPIAATPSNVNLVATADTFSTAQVCVNYSGNPTSCSFSISSVPTDPEGGSYVLAAIDVKYTYTPPIRIPSILGLPITIPSSTIQQRTVMRMVQ